MITLRADLWIPLVAGHFVGDFVLQTDEIVRRKGEPGIALFHAAVVAGVTWLLTGFIGTWFWLIPSILVPHLLIDLGKVRADRWLRDRPMDAGGFLDRNGGLLLFLVDQALHMAVLVGILALVEWMAPLQRTVDGPGLWVLTFGPGYLSFLVLVTGWILATSAAGHTLALGLARFEAELTPDQKTGLSGGGYWIGVTERSLIYLFILLGEPAGIGFLAAAKSVFRIGEIREAEDRKLAEYILIGTLMSFAVAMLVGVAIREALRVLS
jgi:hypothetical protein